MPAYKRKSSGKRRRSVKKTKKPRRSSRSRTRTSPRTRTRTRSRSPAGYSLAQCNNLTKSSCPQDPNCHWIENDDSSKSQCRARSYVRSENRLFEGPLPQHLSVPSV